MIKWSYINIIGSSFRRQNNSSWRGRTNLAVGGGLGQCGRNPFSSIANVVNKFDELVLHASVHVHVFYTQLSF